MSNLKIIPYNRKFPKIFEKEKKKIANAIGDRDIHHIGSTAVPGLGGKGIIDIMIGIKKWQEAKDIVRKLRNIGFKHVHPKEKGRIFLSERREPTPDNVHLHIVKKGSKQYKDLLSFRNYLRKHKKEIKKFFNLKLECLKRAEGNRDKYGKLKEEYVKKILNKIKSL